MDYFVASIIALVLIIVIWYMMASQPDPLDCGCGCGGTKNRVQMNDTSSFNVVNTVNKMGAPKSGFNIVNRINEIATPKSGFNVVNAINKIGGQNQTGFSNVNSLVTAANTINSVRDAQSEMNKSRMRSKDMGYLPPRQAYFTGYPRNSDFASAKAGTKPINY